MLIKKNTHMVKLGTSFLKYKMANLFVKHNKRPFKVSIEGNIGSGKSTCLNYFSKYEDVEIHPEPIDKWRNVSEYNLLDYLYNDDIKKWNFAFQHYVQLTRLQIQASPPISDNKKVKMFERSVQNNRFVFVENAYKSKLLEECEYQILTSWYNLIEKSYDINLDLIVYLRSTPEVVWHRMVKRARNEEIKVPLQYLKDIHSSYENWLNSTNVPNNKILIINADKDLDDVIKQLDVNIDFILGSDEREEISLCNTIN